MSSVVVCGYNVEFPCKPYSVQLALMSKVLSSLNQSTNALLESPTGTGKSLALLCSVLAWQKHQKESQVNSYSEDISNEEEQTEKKQVLNQQLKENVPSKDKFNSQNSIVNKNYPHITIEYTNDKFKENNFPPNQQPAQKSLFGPKNKAIPIVNIKKEKPIEGTNAKPIEVKESPIGKPSLKDSLSQDLEYCSDEDFQPSLKNSKSDKETLRNSNNKEKKDKKETEPKRKKRVPRIYFGTRTHSQVAQLVRELKTTSYRPLMVVLASREHLCIHSKVSKSPNKTTECKKLLEMEACKFSLNKAKLSRSSQIRPNGKLDVWDIEDFVKLGHDLKACPYFASHEISREAEIVFCPYNYLIDPVIRDAMEIDLRGSVVVIDEAHNIEDISRSSSSFDTEVSNIEEAESNLRDLLQKDPEQKELVHSLHQIMSGLLIFLRHALENLNPDDFERNTKVWEGSDIVGLLASCEMNCETFPPLFKKFKEEVGDLGMKAQSLLLVEGLMYIFDYLLMENLKWAKDYRMVIQQVAKIDQNRTKYWSYSVGFWCLNPAVGFAKIAMESRSIILTSGTLTPFNSFASELGCAFPNTLEAAHIINPSQVWVSSIGRGRDGTVLNGSFKSADSLQYQDSIGASLFDYFNTIPSGVLCFLPSYSLLHKLVERWKNTGLWKELSKTKRLFIEPQKASDGDFNEIMQQYYHSVKQRNQYGQSGAVLFAVCRGKVSEGIDFTDENCRGVILVGIPYPQIRDLKVVLKKQFNDSKPNGAKSLSGSAWYSQQAFRALNQALGRCIRHSKDWGAVILLDDRFQQKEYSSQISKWLRNSLASFDSYEKSLESLQNFFQSKTSI